MIAYRIRLKEQLDQAWSAWLGELPVIHEATGATVLMGELADQAALHGLISKVRDLQPTLICVNPLETDSPSKEERRRAHDVTAWCYFRKARSVVFTSHQLILGF